jgi:hypothetical protein
LQDRGILSSSYFFASATILSIVATSSISASDSVKRKQGYGTVMEDAVEVIIDSLSSLPEST